MPYLDGFRGVFTLQAAAMLNAVQGGQLLGEFRGISPAERDRLVAAMGTRSASRRRAGRSNLLVAFNTEKKPFDDVRVRRALLMSIDRWGWQRRALEDLAAALGRWLIRPGSPMATPPEELAKLPGYSKDMTAARAEAAQVLKGSRRAEPEIVLHKPHHRPALYPGGHLPGRPVRQIGVTADHKQFETSPIWRASMPENYEVAIDFSNLFMDDSTLSLAKYLSFDRSPQNLSRAIDRELDNSLTPRARARR